MDAAPATALAVGLVVGRRLECRATGRGKGAILGLRLNIEAAGGAAIGFITSCFFFLLFLSLLLVFWIVLFFPHRAFLLLTFRFFNYCFGSR